MALKLITGPMFADKTSTLIDIISETKNNFIVIKPETDNRYHDHENNIISHNGRKHKAHCIPPDDLLQFIGDPAFPDAGTIFIDEYHFFPGIVHAVKILLENNYNVVVAGIDLNYKRIMMPGFASLEQLAKTHIRLKARCSGCGKLARYTKLEAEFCEDNGANVVGGAEKYSPSCEECF